MCCANVFDTKDFLRIWDKFNKKELADNKQEVKKGVLDKDGTY